MQSFRQETTHAQNLTGRCVPVLCHALAQHHGVEAIAACLGYNRETPKNSNPVSDLQLVEQTVLIFSILSFNRYDKSRIKVIGVEHGIVALIEALIRITKCVARSQLLFHLLTLTYTSLRSCLAAPAYLRGLLVLSYAVKLSKACHVLSLRNHRFFANGTGSRLPRKTRNLKLRS